MVDVFYDTVRLGRQRLENTGPRYGEEEEHQQHGAIRGPRRKQQAQQRASDRAAYAPKPLAYL